MKKKAIFYLASKIMLSLFEQEWYSQINNEGFIIHSVFYTEASTVENTGNIIFIEVFSNFFIFAFMSFPNTI